MKYSESQIIRAIEKNLYSLSLLLSVMPESRYDTGEINWVYTGTGQLNRVFNINIKSNADNKIDEVLNIFKDAKAGVTWIIDTSTYPEDIGKSLEIRGVMNRSHWTGMALDMNMFEKSDDGYPDCDIIEVQNEDTMRLWSKVVTKGFDMADGSDIDFFNIYNCINTKKDKPIRHYLLIKDNVPAAACSVYCKDGIAGLYWVATIPEYRRKGLASQVLYRALYDAYSEGYDLAVLQASDAGKLVYERIGFKAYSIFNIYKWMP